MTLGPRILKTGMAVTLALYICSALNLDPAVFAGVAAIFMVQPSIYRTWKQMLDQILTNIGGAAIALFFVYFLGDSPLTIGLVIMIVISLSLKFKMESTIPLTLVTVLAIMSAPGNEDFLFTLNRFMIILVGIGAAFLVNLVILPHKYKKHYLENVQSAFQSLSLLIRTAISNEMKEKASKELHQSCKKGIKKIKEQFDLLDEERAKLGKGKQLNAREIVVFKQMLKTLQEGEHLLENIEEHYFQNHTNAEENELFDQHLEQLVKCHENLLLRYQGKIKEQSSYGDTDALKQSGFFFEQVLERYSKDKEDKLRLMIIAASVVDYAFHLSRLEELIDQYEVFKD